MWPTYVKAWGARVFAMTSNLVCGLLALKLYGRLSPEAYGVVAAALTVMGYLPLLDGGFRTTINRAVLAEPNSSERQSLLRFGQVFYSWLGLAVLVLAAVLMAGYAASPMGRHSGQSLAFFMALAGAGALSVISSIQAGILVGLQAQTSFFLTTAAGSWLTLAGLWITLERGGGVWAFPISTLCGVLGAYPVALVLIRQRAPGLAFFSLDTTGEFWPCVRRLLSDAWHCFRSQISIVFLYTIDILFVAMFCPAREVAMYTVLSRIFAILRGFLQSMSEISWPIIAQRGWGNQQLNRVLNRMNAWAVGSVTGAVCLTLAPFCGWYIGKRWSVAPELVWLMAARFLVTSLASPAAYLLYGAGDFRAISRCLERELLIACSLALVLGKLFGVQGVAWAFLLGTTAGTLFPIYKAYSGRTGERVPGILVEIWSRAAAGLTISLLCTKLTLGYLASGSQLLVAAAFGLAGGLAACASWSMARMSRHSTQVAPNAILRFMNSI